MEKEKKDAVTVYCGSSESVDERYLSHAYELGEALAAHGVTVVTGAGRTGMMGAVAAGALGKGGKVRGIIPQFMVDRGWHNQDLTELTVVDTMHSRKALMASVARGCIALPGGIGTFEELNEIITWRQLGLFDGNVVIFNDGGYYDPLLAMFDRAIGEGFMRPDHRRIYAVASTVEEAVELALCQPENLTFSPKF